MCNRSLYKLSMKFSLLFSPLSAACLKDVYGQLPSVPLPVGRPKLRYKDALKEFKKTYIYSKYTKLETTGTGSRLLALSPTKQTNIFDPNVHHRLRLLPN